MNKVRVSIILPVYNGARFLSRAIASVLQQTFRDWELIVIDDGSRDETAAIVNAAATKDERIRYFFQTNSGIQKTLNRGLSLSRGEYIARIDDDDEWIDPKKLELQLGFLDKNPDHAFLGTGTIVVDEKGKELFRFLNPETDGAIRKKILRRNCFTHSSVVFRKSSLQALHGYSEDKNVLHVEDYDLWLRLGERGKMANLSRYATQFMLRAQNISSQNKTDQLRKDISLVRKYGHTYPRFKSSLLFAYARFFAYRYLMPARLRGLIFRVYKYF